MSRLKKRLEKAGSDPYDYIVIMGGVISSSGHLSQILLVFMSSNSLKAFTNANCFSRPMILGGDSHLRPYTII